MAGIKEFSEAVVDGGNVGTPKMYIADTASDIANLPTPPKVAWGSFCICLANKKIYTLRESGIWEEFGA